MLAILAVASIVLTPWTAPSAARSMGAPIVSGMQVDLAAGVSDAAASMPDDMPCCPPDGSPPPDCTKSCPMAAPCLSKCFGAAAFLGVIPLRLVYLERLKALDELAPDTLAQLPPPRPPRS